MTIRFVELDKTRRDGEVEHLSFGPHVTALVGPRNSSKTTILRMIDFCLGDPDSAPEALGPAVAEAYAALNLTIDINGQRHQISRALVPSVGHLTKVQVGSEELSTRDFQRWLMEELNWSELEIPKGRAYRSASETFPLTFRALFRHLYRKETSWFDFASREEEFLRQAVVAFFLELAEGRYAASLLEYQLGETERELDALHARQREVAEQGDVLIRRVGRAFGEDELSLDRLDAIHAAAVERRIQLELERQEILQTMRSSDQVANDPGARYQVVDAEATSLTSSANDLRRTLVGYESAVREVDGQVLRLERADAAVDAFAQVPVHICPACGQDISGSPGKEECYVCHQPISADVRRRRILLEIAALKRERQELERVVGATRDELHALEVRLRELKREQEVLRERLDRERADLIAPYLTQLESLSSQLGAVDQQVAMLDALRALTERVETIEAEIVATATRLDEQASAANRVHSRRALEEERTSAFAEAMSGYLEALSTERWRFGSVTIASADFSFYVGSRSWDVALGAESRVLFFLAYTEALFRLEELGVATHRAGFAILDNPLQHGISEAVAAEGLRKLAGTARSLDQQLIVTLPRDLSFDEDAHVIRLTQQFVP